VATTYKQVTRPNRQQKERAGNCLRFTFLAFGGQNGRGFDESREAWDGQSRRHLGTYPPKGIEVPVWFDWTGTVNGVRKNWGHTAIRLADGRVLSSPYAGFGQMIFPSIKALEKGFGARYLGWSEWMDGTQVVEVTHVAEKRRSFRKKLKPVRVNLRAKPTTSSRVLRVMRPGVVRRVTTWTRGERVHGSDVWIRVRYGLRIGWVHSSCWAKFTPNTTRLLRELKR